jgi:hypothetical protein
VDGVAGKGQRPRRSDDVGAEQVDPFPDDEPEHDCAEDPVPEDRRHRWMGHRLGLGCRGADSAESLAGVGIPDGQLDAHLGYPVAKERVVRPAAQ